MLYGLAVALLFLGVHTLTESVYQERTEELYEHSILFIQKPLILTLILLLFGMPFRRFRKYISYKHLLPNKSIRISLFLLCFLISWNLIFSSFNFYFNQWYVPDRLLLLILLAFCWTSPLFLIPFLAQLFLLLAQYQLPLGGFPILDRRLAIEVLIVSGSIGFIEWMRSFIPRLRDKEFPIAKIWFYFAACLFGAFYFHSAVKKLEISPNTWEWLYENDILNNLKAMHHRGWLQNWPTLHTVQLKYFSLFNGFGPFFILLMEFFGIVLLLHKRLFWAFAISMVFFHLNVFFLNGALFIPWIVCGISLILISRKIQFRYNLTALLLSFLIIYQLPQYIFIPELAWFDSKIDGRFQVYSKNQKGELKEVSMSSLAPFNENFQVGNQQAVVKSKTVGIGFLQLEYPPFKFLETSDSAQLVAYLQNKGYSIYNENARSRMSLFIDRYKQNHPKAKKINQVLRSIHLPHYFNADASRPPELIEIESSIELQYNVYLQADEGAYQLISSETVYPDSNKAREAN